MPIAFACPVCKSVFSLHEQFAGVQINCPKYKTLIIVPGTTRTEQPTRPVIQHTGPAVQHVCGPSQPAPQALAQNPSKSITMGCVLVFMLAISCCCLPMWLLDTETGGPPASHQDRDNVGAWIAAQRFVKDHLKSPSTASFGGAFSEYQDPDKCVRSLGGGLYRVNGWVDSQNSFGATVRVHFTLKVQDKGGGRWSLVEAPLILER
jgi:hypothetical protein